MTRLSFLILLLTLSIGITITSASEVNISFRILYGSSQCLKLDTLYNENDHNIQFSTLKFYISTITLADNGSAVYNENNSYHLVDLSNPDSQEIILEDSKNINYNSIEFNLGIDSITNVSGVFGGELDPTKGMYWTWQSGYINFKLEGTSSKSLDPNHEFSFHLGGYRSPLNPLQRISLETNKNQIEIILDVSSIINDIDLEHMNSIMSPDTKAIEISHLIATNFRVNNP